MADINQVQLPDGSQYNIKDDVSGYATETYVQNQISGITKATIGLGNVDNTSDANKPVSTAQQTALDAKTNTSVIAYTETSTTATKRYEIGDQFILNGVLYTATAIIANGGTITVGTNCTASDTIIEQLSNILADNVAFDNTGTDLVSENVEGAIKEVNERTKHGIVELWKNSSPSSDFAGQTITINDYDTTKYDAIILVIGSASETFVPRWMEIDNDFIGSSFIHGISSMNMDSNLDWIYLYKRTVTLTLNGTTLSLAFSDCTITTNKGGAITNTTGNGVEIPIRILGLIHND